MINSAPEIKNEVANAELKLFSSVSGFILYSQAICIQVYSYNTGKIAPKRPFLKHSELYIYIYIYISLSFDKNISYMGRRCYGEEVEGHEQGRLIYLYS